ncbi:MAG: hypothetical protein KGJ02_07200 [Verrucomicrobiota bacterium]|nr:hypothetical protein [Verrucomicrobiota bacterium]
MNFQTYTLNFVFVYDYRAMEIEFQTEINPAEARLHLVAGLALTAAGIAAYTFFLLFIKELSLAPFLIGGLYPWMRHCLSTYRKMRAQARFPDRLRLEQKALVYCPAGKPALQIPYACIEGVAFRDGIAVQLKKPLPQKLTVLDSNFRLSKFLQDSSKQKTDLFFGWFNPLVKARLNDIVHPNQANHLATLQDG